MRNRLGLIIAIAVLLVPCSVLAEEQVRDSFGRVTEIKQSYGNASYAYDWDRTPRYVAVRFPGGKGALNFIDKYGVHVGVGGPGTLPWAVRGTWGRKD
jgi:hypothetical protein